MISTIYFKEMKLFFRHPITYLIAGVYTLIIGWLIFSQISYFAQNIQVLPTDLRTQYDFSNQVIIKLFGNINFIFLFIVPFLTMRIFSEEYKSGTINLYFTSYVSDVELVLAKFLAAFSQAFFLLSLTMFFPFFLGNLDVSDTNFVITGYFGLCLNLMCYCALGCLASALSKNILIASIMGFMFILVSWMMNMFSFLSSHYFFSEIILFLSVNSHFENFVQANISISDITFYFSFIVFCLILLVKRVGIRNW